MRRIVSRLVSNIRYWLSFRFAVASFLVFTAACAREGPEDLVVATCWPHAERVRIEADFRAWLAERNGPARSARLCWVGLDARRRPPAADILLGGPSWRYCDWAEKGLVALSPENGWFVVRRRRFGLFENLEVEAEAATISLPQLAVSGQGQSLALADPSDDAPSLALAAGCLRELGWDLGFATLFRLYRSALIVRGDPTRAVERGRARTAIVPGGPSRTLLPAIFLEEGAALTRSPKHEEGARAFLAFLRERRPDAEREAVPIGPVPPDLLADFLSATLVLDHPQAWSGDMSSVPAPPWPPASIKALHAREDGEELVQLLTEELVPDAQARAWLTASWEWPGVVDESVLAGIALAADGRLLREPRFRSWLRAEWTAWSRAQVPHATRPRP